MSIAIEYRMPPAYLSTTAIIAELYWIDEAVNWRGALGDHARARAAALRAELRRREWAEAVNA